MPEIAPALMLIFPGQGSQYVGMGADLVEAFPVARRTYEEASDLLGFDIGRLSFEGPAEELNRTHNTQPAVLTHSVACLRTLEALLERPIAPMVTAGNSLGEYTALYAAGGLSFERALRLVRERGVAMGRHGRGGIVATRLELAKAEHVAARFHCAVSANNSPRQTTIGGDDPDLVALAQYMKEAKLGPALRLQTEGAFHTFLMDRAADAFAQVLQSVEISALTCRVISNYSGHFHDAAPEHVREQLCRQVASPVRWLDGMRTACAAGVNLVIELGGARLGSGPPAHRVPNLKEMTSACFADCGASISYLGGINVATLGAVAQTLAGLARVTTIEHDDEPSPTGFGRQGNAVNETWFHLLIPEVRGMVVPAALPWVERVQDLGLAEVVQLVAQDAEQHQRLAAFLGQSGASHLEPLLEVIVGCETAAALYSHGDEIEKRLQELRGQLDRTARRPNVSA